MRIRISRRECLLAATAAQNAAQQADTARVLTFDLSSGGPYTFPPKGKAYREDGASHRVWRRILVEAPDAVVVPSGVPANLAQAGAPVFSAHPERIPVSRIHATQAARLRRPPAAWATELSGIFGQNLPAMVYTQSFSIWGRIRAGQAEAVSPILEPFLSGKVDSLAKATASHYSGHLTLAGWYFATRDPRARLRVLAAARMARELPQDSEMSDSVFMVCPILATAGRLSADPSYYTAAHAHWERMRGLCLRPDGLYRHSPLDEAAWGRGNAFPLLGLALTLEQIPPSHPVFAPLREAYTSHARAMLAHQQPSGCWRQVIDRPSAWEEFTVTAMTGWALRIGLRRHWLAASPFAQASAKAWTAIRNRTLPDGILVDVCESTGKQPNLTAYLNREALLGRDPRGGAMALLLASDWAAQ